MIKKYICHCTDNTASAVCLGNSVRKDITELIRVVSRRNGKSEKDDQSGEQKKLSHISKLKCQELLAKISKSMVDKNIL